MKIGLGVLKLDPDVFWRMSIREFTLARQGFFENEQSDSQQRWETARFTGWCAIAPHDIKRRMKSPKDLIKFEWEKAAPAQRVKLTPAQIDYMVRKMGRHMDNEGNYYN